MSIWLSSEILTWRKTYDLSLTFVDPKLLDAYNYLMHVEKIIGSGNTEYDRNDILSNLKKSIFFRIEQLKTIYNLRGFPLKDKSSKEFDILCSLNIIKPIMLKKIIDIRNAIEHKYNEPPSFDYCKELSEFVWYFLKATDILIELKIEKFDFVHNNEKDEYYLEVKIEFSKNWNIYCNALYPLSL
jgi:hypothetical protein